MENELHPMAIRIAQLVEAKTGGNRTAFAEKIGWAKQRLGNVLAGKCIGLATVEAILSAFPDINARWLIFGEGNMLEVIEPKFGTRFDNILKFERYLPYMTEAEVALLTCGKNDWSEADIARWEALDKKRRDDINARFSVAYAKQGWKWKNI